MEANQQELNELVGRMEHRIDKLEKTNRRYLRGITALVVSAAFAIPFIPSDTNAKAKGKTLIADRLALMAGPKQVGMLLTPNKIAIMGPAGKVRLTMSTNDKGQPMVSLNGPDQKPRLTLRYTAKQGAHWLMYGADGKAIVKQLK